MLKYGWWVLGALLAFGAIFALLPSPAQARDTSGVRLYGVDFRLYPAQDVDAEWRFRADRIDFDPVSGESKLAGLSKGERFVRENGGEPRLDSTIETGALTIDAGSNLLTRKAVVYVPAQCATVRLEGTPDTPVRIDQNAGFLSPKGSLRFPGLTASYKNVRATFALVVQNADSMKVSSDLDSKETCENGKLVTKR